MPSSSINQRAIFEGMTRTLPVLAFVVDADGVFREIIANGYTDDFLFDEPENVIGNSITTLFTDDKTELFEENIDQALQTGAVQEFEYSLPIDRKHRTFAGYMAPMDEDMDEELVIWIAEDITGRKEHTRELERHEVFLESIREEVLVTNADFVITYESAAAPKLYGYDQGARVGDQLLQYVHPDDTEQVRTHFESQLTESGSIDPIEFRGKQKDGTWTWVESQARLLNDNPAVGGIVITTRDISERVEERTKRKRQHDHLVNAENLANVGGWEYIPENETVRWTKGTKQIFDVSDDFEPTLSNAISFYHETDQPIIEEAVENCLETGVEYSIDARILTDKGRTRWIQSTGKRSTEDGVMKLSGVVQDITDRKGREQRLAVLNRVLRHNLRNEMTAIIGFAKLLQEELPAEEKKYPSKIVANSENLLSLAEKSKQFEEAMKYNYISGPVDIKPILEDLCTEYREKYLDATIKTNLSNGQAPGNEMAIKLIFQELIDNGLNHSERDHPTVSIISASPSTQRIKISVVDDGPGLPGMEQQVMESGEETPLKHSNGIGLWTTNWLVSELRGDIQVTATEGEGTAITVTIPGEKI